VCLLARDVCWQTSAFYLAAESMSVLCCRSSHAENTHSIPSYKAKLTSTQKREDKTTVKQAIKQGLLGSTFVMSVPAGLEVLGYSARPSKLATTLTFNNASRVLMLTVNKPSKSVRLAVKMQAAACTTPAALALNGKLFYSSVATGARTVDACLKKPVGEVRGGESMCTRAPVNTIHTKQPPPPSPPLPPKQYTRALTRTAICVGARLPRGPQLQGGKKGRQGSLSDSSTSGC
jgi:hypothetical protein